MHPLLNYASLEQLSEIYWNYIKWDSNGISKWTSEMHPLLNYASLEQLSEIFRNYIKWDSNGISEWTSEMQTLIKQCKFRAIIRNLLEWH